MLVRVGGRGGRAYRIHCGSSVTVSPGVTMDLVESLGRLEGGGMSVSPSESREEESEESLWRIGGRVIGEVIVKGIVEVLSWLERSGFWLILRKFDASAIRIRS